MGGQPIGASRYNDGRSVARTGARRALSLASDAPLVVVDGGRHDHRLIDVAAVSTPGWRWVVLSAPPGDGSPTVTYSWTDDSQVWCIAADVIVTTDRWSKRMDPGQATIVIADAAKRTPWAPWVPAVFANVLVHHGWPTADLWPDVLAEALMGDRGHGLDAIRDDVPVSREDPRP